MNSSQYSEISLIKAPQFSLHLGLLGFVGLLKVIKELMKEADSKRNFRDVH